MTVFFFTIFDLSDFLNDFLVYIWLYGSHFLVMSSNKDPRKNVWPLYVKALD